MQHEDHAFIHPLVIVQRDVGPVVVAKTVLSGKFHIVLAELFRSRRNCPVATTASKARAPLISLINTFSVQESCASREWLSTSPILFTGRP
jgi:hypothetical protein